MTNDPNAGRGGLLSQLHSVLQEVARRRNQGEQLSDDEVLADHPQLAELLASGLEKLRRIELAGEQAVRGRPADSDSASLDGTPHTPHLLRVRCPHCREPNDVATDEPISEVVCPSCGSRFGLATSSEETWPATALPTLAHFDLVERVGMGSFGTVWKGRDRELDRTVAVKIPRQGSMNEQDVEKFLREARAAAQLKHPHIVGVHEVGRDGELVFIVSDFVRGVSLDDWMTGEQPAMRQTAALCATIAEALHHAHERGVVHRDLKPANIMIDGEGQPHLMDFGLARRDAGEVTMTIEGQVLGTPAYMSPEQAQGESHSADRRSDVYSLGVILFQLITGELPFRGSARMLMHHVIHDEPPNPATINPMVPKDLATIALKCLEKDPAKRYPTAQALADDLSRWLAGQPILARPIGPVARGWRWCKRNRAVATLTVGIAGTLVVGLASATLFAIRAQTAEQNAREFAIAERNARIETTGALERAQHSQYVAQMRLVERAIDERSPDVRTLLENTPPLFRQWEWWFASNEAPGELATCVGHDDVVRSVAFNPNGKQIASGSWDGSLRLWDVATGQPLRMIRGHSDRIYGIAFSPDGRRLASAGLDGNLKLWDVETGAEVGTIKGPNDAACICVDFNSQGSQIAIGSIDENVYLLDAVSGTVMKKLVGHRAPVHGVDFSPDDRQIASASWDSSVKLWDIESGQAHSTFNGHEGRVFAVAFSPDAQHLASAGEDKTVRVWDVRMDKQVRVFEEHDDMVFSVAFGLDGQSIAAGSRDRTVRLWAVDSGLELGYPKSHHTTVAAVAISPDGCTLASGSFDRTLKLWSTKPGNEQVIFKDGAAVHCVAFSEDSQYLASAGEDSLVRIRDCHTGAITRQLQGHQAAVRGVVFSLDGTEIISASDDNTVRSWDLRTGEQLRTFTHAYGVVNHLALHGSDLRVVAGGADGALGIFDPRTTWRLATPSRTEGPLSAAANSPDYRWIAAADLGSGSRPGLTVWNARTGEQQWTRRPLLDEVVCVAFCNDSLRIAVGGRDASLTILNCETGSILRNLLGHTGVVRSVVFSPNGQRVFSVGEDNTLKVWDTQTGEELRTLRELRAKPSSIAISPDGWKVAVGCSDGTTILLNAEPSSPL